MITSVKVKVRAAYPLGRDATGKVVRVNGKAVKNTSVQYHDAVVELTSMRTVSGVQNVKVETLDAFTAKIEDYAMALDSPKGIEGAQEMRVIARKVFEAVWKDLHDNTRWLMHRAVNKELTGEFFNPLPKGKVAKEVAQGIEVKVA